MTAHGYRFLVCPDCGKRGVHMKMSRVAGEDGWSCRYCGWWAYDSGEDDIDRYRRARLSNRNPDDGIWITDIPAPVPQRNPWKEKQ